jgi:hypothetical protein
MNRLMMVIAMAAAPAAAAPPLPFDLTARTVILSVHAAGAQVYQCKATQGAGAAWTFREPIATLIQGDRTIGRHFVGPHWALDDGSLVAAKQAETSPGSSAADIPQLKLNIVTNAGTGILAQATQVYRINTLGGVLAGACPLLGELRAMPYTAAYVFAR